MRMNIGIGRFCLKENATRNPQLFLKITFLMFVVWVDTKKAGLLLVNLPLVYLVDLFTEELYKDLNYMFRLILLFSEQNIIY